MYLSEDCRRHYQEINVLGQQLYSACSGHNYCTQSAPGKAVDSVSRQLKKIIYNFFSIKYILTILCFSKECLADLENNVEMEVQ